MSSITKLIAAESTSRSGDIDLAATTNRFFAKYARSFLGETVTELTLNR